MITYYGTFKFEADDDDKARQKMALEAENSFGGPVRLETNYIGFTQMEAVKLERVDRKEIEL